MILYPPQFPRWLSIAEGELGVREIRGDRSDNRIIGYLKTVLNIGKYSRNRDETPWCAAFVNWCLNQAGYEGTDHALARSFIEWGVGLNPKLGAVVVLRYKRGNDSSTGSRFGYHVGFFIREHSHSYRILGGNQSDSVSYRNFPKKHYKLVASRWPTTRTDASTTAQTKKA